MSKLPSKDEWWKTEFAYLHIIAECGDYVWVRVLPRTDGLHESLKTMSKYGFEEYERIDADTQP